MRHYPRLRLESPINPSVAQPKSKAGRMRFGMHSLPSKSKWNSQWPDLIEEINGRHGDRVAWDFMGMPDALRKRITADNVTFRPEFLVPVPDFLCGVDVFGFFLDWRREEAWARSAGEALMSGCPLIATARGGNRDQVIHGNTGFLCSTLEEMIQGCTKLLEQPGLLEAMSANARAFARGFASDEIAKRLLRFLE